MNSDNKNISESTIIADTNEIYYPDKDIECPVCKSIKRKILWGKYTCVEAADQLCPPSRNVDRNERFRETIQKLWKQDYSYVLRCADCGFGFGYPYIGGDEKFYNILHEQYGYPSNRWEYDITIDDFFKKNPVTRIIDIGAGSGYFLSKIDCKERYALEGGDTTRTILKNKGITVYNDHEKLIEEHINEFNYVTMYQVLEHLSAFENFFRTANKILNKKGNFIISVPDCEAMINQEKLTGCIDMVPNHINKWTPQSLKIALERNGFEIKEIVYEPSSLKKFIKSVYFKVLAKAAMRGSFASKIYSIKNKKLRIPAIASYSFILIPGMLKNYKKLNGKSSFLVRAEKKNEIE